MADKYGLSKIKFPKKIWVLAKYLHTASSPDARWGTVSILLSISFFCFGLSLAFLTIYLSPDWRISTMLALIIIFTVIGFGVFCWAIWMGWHFWHTYGDLPTLVVTGDIIEYNTNKAQVKKGQIIISTNKYEITIIQKAGNIDDK